MFCARPKVNLVSCCPCPVIKIQIVPNLNQFISSYAKLRDVDQRKWVLIKATSLQSELRMGIKWICLGPSIFIQHITYTRGQCKINSKDKHQHNLRKSSLTHIEQHPDRPQQCPEKQHPGSQRIRDITFGKVSHQPNNIRKEYNTTAHIWNHPIHKKARVVDHTN